jgi:putative transposase
MERVRIYAPSGMPTRKGIGDFAWELLQHFPDPPILQHFPDLPIEEEGRLSDPRLRENWIERFFAYHRMELGSRKVILFNVTEHPTLEWTKEQVRNACFEEQPKFLLHDNDGKFGQLGRPLRLECDGKKVSCRSAYDVWLWQEMGIRGIPIPYGAPNAAARMERLIGTLRRECLDRMLIWNERHLRSSLAEFVRWYNQGRVHQGLNAIPDPDPAIADPKP